MSIIDAGASADALKAEADQAIQRGGPQLAIAPLERATTLAPYRPDLWLALAACRRALGDARGAMSAVDGALKVDPRCFPALLMKGSMLESQGHRVEAAMTYRAAVVCAPDDDEMAEPMRRALNHAGEVLDRYSADLAASLKAEVGLTEGAVRSGVERRLNAFVEAMAGRRKIYAQEPVRFHYPGLPAIEFFDRDEFAWLEAFEARTDEIRQELLAVWHEGSPALEPYINYADGLPLDQWAELNRSLNWSAYHLYLDGQKVEAHARQCPATMSALDLAPQPHINRRSPSAMFSILRPRTRIPPHTGVANTRMVVHLPLIVPEGCGFRVGGETRSWREGEAWVFDDTIEHEAWNDSDKPRAILICDIWNPRLPEDEREVVARLMSALDRFTGATDGGGL